MRKERVQLILIVLKGTWNACLAENVIAGEKKQQIHTR